MPKIVLGVCKQSISMARMRVAAILTGRKLLRISARVYICNIGIIIWRNCGFVRREYFELMNGLLVLQYLMERQRIPIFESISAALNCTSKVNWPPVHLLIIVVMGMEHVCGWCTQTLWKIYNNMVCCEAKCYFFFLLYWKMMHEYECSLHMQKFNVKIFSINFNKKSNVKKIYM